MKEMKKFDEQFPSLKSKFGKYKLPSGKISEEIIFTQKQHIVNNCLDKQDVINAIDHWTKECTMLGLAIKKELNIITKEESSLLLKYWEHPKE